MRNYLDQVGLWVCSMGDFLDYPPGLDNKAHCECHHSLCWTLNCMKVKEVSKKASRLHACIGFFPSRLDMVWPAVSSPAL